MNIVILERTEETVTISSADFEALLDRVDDRSDQEAVRRSEDLPPKIRFTADETRQIVLDGVSPMRVFRKRAALSQAELARVVGLGTSYVNEIETGEKPGSVDALRRVAEARSTSRYRTFSDAKRYCPSQARTASRCTLPSRISSTVAVRSGWVVSSVAA